MKFLYPAFLFALFVLLIPVLIHLFSFRRYVTVYFSNVSYLKNIRNESQKHSRLKNLLILLCRILAISAMVFMFAQPYLPVRNSPRIQANPIVSVYIDNSFSMSAVSSGGQLLEVARNKALQVAGSCSPDTRFQLITNDLLPKHRHFLNKEQFLQQVSEVRPSPRAVQLSQIRDQMVNNVWSSEKGAALTGYFISDFQTSMCDLHHFKSDTNQAFYFLPLQAEVSDNLYIDSCWMEIPAHKIGQEEKLNIRIFNHSSKAYQNLPLRFYLDDTLKALGNFSIDPGKSQVIQLKYINPAAGIHRGRAEISDFPFIHDNTWYLNYLVQSHVNLLVLYDARMGKNSGIPYLKALFEDDEFIHPEFTPVDNLQISKLSAYQAIIILNIKSLTTGLIHEMKKSVESGTTLLFFPEPEGDFGSYNSFLMQMNASTILRKDTAARQIGGLEWAHPAFSQVFEEQSDDIHFPSVKGSLYFSRGTRVSETALVWYRDKSGAVTLKPSGEGNLIVFGFPLSTLNSEFARDLLFVPLMYSVIINSLPGQKLSYKIGQESYGTLPGQWVPDLSSLKILSADSTREFIPATTLLPGNRLKFEFTDFFRDAGHYLIQSGKQTVSAISMNYDRSESLFDFYSPSGLEVEIGKNGIRNTSVIEVQSRDFEQVYGEIRHGKKLWKLFLLLALIFLLAEVTIIRFWK